ncbi:MAG: hypothetical protein HOW97_29885 [Catenulispora sp.]|nr:hypothetical protein [Catenulispora sp.]
MPGYDFEVRPQVLADYADALDAAARDLGAVREALAGTSVERGWFGRLPESGLLADRYAAHKEAELAAGAELGAWVARAAQGLRVTAGRYSGADRVVADLAGAVGAGALIAEVEEAGG